MPTSEEPRPPASTRSRSKTLTAWLALLFGTLGAHRFYLHGARDPVAWLFPLPTFVGLYGLMRMRNLGVDDKLGWILVPLLGLMISVAMLSAIVYALTSEAKWQQRYAPLDAGAARTGIGAVMAAIFALLLGGAVSMATLAFSAQKFFEWQLASPTVAAAVTGQGKRAATWSVTAPT